MKITPILLTLCILTSFLPAQQKTGYLKLYSNPEGANVVIDGKTLGVTPLTVIELTPGMHSVELSFESYENESFQVRIIADEIEKRTVVLHKKEGFKLKRGETKSIEQGLGKLTVITSPSEASVTIDGQTVQEKTPFTVEELGVGLHRLRASVWLPEPWNKSVDVDKITEILKNKTTTLKIDFYESYKVGELEINATNNFYINVLPLEGGLIQGLTNGSRIKLPIGDYSLSWRDGMGIQAYSVTIRPKLLAKVFVPYLSATIPTKTIASHPDYIDFETFERRNARMLPEQVMVSKHSTETLFWGITFLALGTAVVAAPHAESDALKYGGGIAILGGGGLMVFKTEDVQMASEENIQKNAKTRNSVKQQYQIAVDKWTRDISRANADIDKTNQEILRKNAELPKPSVQYE